MAGAISKQKKENEVVGNGSSLSTAREFPPSRHPLHVTPESLMIRSAADGDF
ncbi:MAG: hypothetical protein ACK6DC_03695 [Planctomycetota bacterium]|jgi:hypothetical protein